MSITVSDWAKCCAQCGWIEPLNIEEIEGDETCTIAGVYAHREDCRAHQNGVEHELFMALWNARIHMEVNDVLSRRANESLTEAMTCYIKNQLGETSFFARREQDKFWEEQKPKGPSAQ